MVEQIFLHQKQFSLLLRKESLATRLQHLSALEKMISENTEAILTALSQDFSKPPAETLLSEIYPVLKEIRVAKKNLRQWMKPRRARTPLLITGTKSYVVPEPKGVCLIVGPWNYPFQLCLSPLVSALAAGNCAIIKPSEFTTHTSALLKTLIQKTFNEEHVTLIEGGVEKTQELLQLPFDHIFFTGSTRVGKIVMEAASKHLSSVTLELGGKSPTIVDSSANLEIAAEKIAWAKFVNAGQTCIAPDYILVQRDVLSQFKTLLMHKIDAFYGKSPLEKKNSPDLARVISPMHTARLKNMLDEAVSKNAEVVYGGECDVDEKYMAPTLLEKVDLHTKLMKEEIFGPLLPLVPFKDLHEAIHFINERPKPLALYLYSNSKMNIEDVTRETSSGALVINDSVIHFINPNLPFGGVGESGMGNYHGHFGFKAFSHEKALLKQGFLGKLMRIIYPPYTPFKLNLLFKLIRWKI
ncbi:aldehyde dehydrogenase family protein [Bdellovibrio sp. 22V]|uniref:aldehyde dehydrogenase family protein n=1 Tax=Bdellovibrio TaxID=958 RepID=UPI002543BE94|nr:aldehyde dehydrogenase family protein [Bdellovibrio sp. 22V]WII71616.1 aldehyde dehydrogenase family protein [Bdellovibrio sp. 22V]